ncbi:hypothetical protein C8R45DRAFT_1017884 [Mycena sanguinolenta]|nr:hypothetical protein C8R45DRAFT_1017884 [Mycena sanguinolenta]
MLALVAIGGLLLYLRRRRQKAHRRFSGTDTSHPLDPSLPVSVITPFTSATTTMLQIPISEKDVIVSSSKLSPLSASDSASASRSSSGLQLPSDSEQQQAIERLEREVQILRAQQQLQQAQNPLAFDNTPPPSYEPPRYLFSHMLRGTVFDLFRSASVCSDDIAQPNFVGGPSHAGEDNLLLLSRSQHLVEEASTIVP